MESVILMNKDVKMMPRTRMPGDPKWEKIVGQEFEFIDEEENFKPLFSGEITEKEIIKTNDNIYKVANFVGR